MFVLIREVGGIIKTFWYKTELQDPPYSPIFTASANGVTTLGVNKLLSMDLILSPVIVPLLSKWNGWMEYSLDSKKWVGFQQLILSRTYISWTLLNLYITVEQFRGLIYQRSKKDKEFTTYLHTWLMPINP